MAFPRRFLPSMSLLCAFEAAARHQSFTAAAAELSLTQSAVSRQIRALEELLGSDLFHRERQTVRLTSAGEAYGREIRDALKLISGATLGFRANPAGGSLNLAILPTFGTRWLAPRLSKLLSEQPGITINLSTRLDPFDFNLDTADAAIHFGLPDWPGAVLEELMSEEVVPACSPDMLDQHRFETPVDLLRVPLLHLVSRPDAWRRWFSAAGVDTDAVPGMSIDQFATAAQAATAGLGVALLPKFLIQPELERGELVVAYDAPLTSTERYYLAWPPNRSNHPPLQTFRRWLKAEAAEYQRGDAAVPA
jgi:LysR family glycine cleavage system transcriptional activator